MRYLPPRAYLQYTTRQGPFHLPTAESILFSFQPSSAYYQNPAGSILLPIPSKFLFFFIPLLYSLLGVISSHHCQFGCTPKKEEELGLFYSYLIRFQRSTSWPTRFRLGRTQQLRRRLLVRWVTGSVLLLLLRLGVPASTFSSSLIPD